MAVDLIISQAVVLLTNILQTVSYLIVFELSYNMRKGRENENEFLSVLQQDFFRYDGKGNTRVYKETDTMDVIKGLYRETRERMRQ